MAQQQTFDIDIRVLSCERCGAPVEVPELGGATTCNYCGTQMLVGRRRLDPVRVAHALTGDARIAKLRLQTGRDLPENPYSTVRPPPGCEGLVRSGLEPVQVQLGQRFREAVALVRADPSFDHQRLLWWCATILNQGYGLVDKHLERRAVLERAVEELTDPGFRHMLYVNLAGAAARFGEFDAARAWADKCDPEPEDLLLDSGYRVGMASVLVGAGELAPMLALVGAHVGDVPEAHQYRLMFAMYRMHGHELLGDGHKALEAGTAIMADPELGGVVVEALGLNKLAPKTAAILVGGGQAGVVESPSVAPGQVQPGPSLFESAGPGSGPGAQPVSPQPQPANSMITPGRLALIIILVVFVIMAAVIVPIMLPFLRAFGVLDS